MIKIIFADEYGNAGEIVDDRCPCRLFPKEYNRCFCKDFKDKIAREELGLCECGLYEIVKE